MPFSSPFGIVSTPSFNPSYSNVPQNKTAKPVAVPQNKPNQSLSTPPKAESSIDELTAGITPQIFMPQSVPAPQMPMQPAYTPYPFNPNFNVMPTMQVPRLGAPEQVENPTLPQRLNPYRPIFV